MSLFPDKLECGVAAGNDIPHYMLFAEVDAFDIDRTIVRTPESVDLLLESALRAGAVDDAVVSEVRQRQTKTEADGGSFDPLQFLQKQMDAETFSQLGETLISAHWGALAYPDAAELTRRLTTADQTWPHLYVTYGKNALWQGIKACLGACKGTVVITDTSDKGPVLDSWRNPYGRFDFVGLNGQGQPQAVYHAPGIRLTDDKGSAFKNLPTDCTGRMLWRKDEDRLPSQGTEVPPHVADRVSCIHGLGELIVSNAMLWAPCSPAPDGTPPNSAAFRPNIQNGHPTITIAPDMPFTALCAAIERAQARR